MREEEEKMAEEDTREDMLLTYDRPDICNKVTLRRSSTGMWEVCSSGQNQKMRNKISDKNGDNEYCINKRVLRSGNSHYEAQVDSVTTYGNVKLKVCHRNGSRQLKSSSKHHDEARSSPKVCTKDSIVVLSSIPEFQSSDNMDRVCEDKNCGGSRSTAIKESSELCYGCIDTEASLDHSHTNNVSSVNHKYSTRQKVTLRNI